MFICYSTLKSVFIMHFAIGSSNLTVRELLYTSSTLKEVKLKVEFRRFGVFGYTLVRKYLQFEYV